MHKVPRRIGKYELQERLGQGGMAEVWRALDPHLQRYVAIKFLHADLQSDSDLMRRFEREAQVMASLRHPNIVQIHDFQASRPPETDDTIVYMVMDYIEGPTLADYIAKTSRIGKFPSNADIVHIFSCISAAIDYAHRRGMIHRDIKPSNIMLDQHNITRNPMGEPILMDFGIVRLLGVSTSGTLSGIWMGTPNYMSPEQATGQSGNELSDLYSLGVILYEICTGVVPFHGDSPLSVVVQHISATPTPPALINPNVPTALSEVIFRSIAKEPAARFPSASALTVAIAQALNIPLSTSMIPTRPIGEAGVSTFVSLSPPSLLPPETKPFLPLLPTSRVSSEEDFIATMASASKNLTPIPRAEIEHPAKFILRANDGDVLQEYLLDKYKIVIGRAPYSDISLSNDKLVSRFHATIHYENGHYLLRDERSANGTLVNGQQLEEVAPYILQDGDHVDIGENEMIFRSFISTGVEDMPTVGVKVDPPEQTYGATIGTRFELTVEEDFGTISFGTAPEVAAAPPEEQAVVENAESRTFAAELPHSTLLFDETIIQLLEEGENHYKARRYEEALTVFRRATQLDPRNARAHGNKGNALGKRGKYKEALAAYNTALDIDPEHASIWNSKGDVLSKLRRYEEALAAYDAALARKPKDAARTWAAKGKGFSRLRRYEEALDAYDQSIALHANHLVIWAKGKVLFNLKRYEEALIVYEHILAIAPKKAAMWDEKGEILYKLERYQEALDVHSRALALDPYNNSIASKCDRLRDLIKHLKEQASPTQGAGASTHKGSDDRTQHSPDAVQGRPEQFEAPKQPTGGAGSFHVFLSHSHEDTRWVEDNLAKRLEDEHGFRIWLDIWKLIPGESFQQARARSLDQAQCCAVCIGKRTPSEWFKQEIERALNRRAKDPSFRVIPVLLPNARDVNVDDFLELNALVDFRDADFERAFHVLVCGVKGIPPGRWPPEEVTLTRTSTIAENMLLDLQRLGQNNLIPDPIREEYIRLTMQEFWVSEWKSKFQDGTNEG